MAEDPPNTATEEDSSKALPKNSLYRRHEQLQRWKGSPTDREPMALKRPAKRVKFNDGCMFLAACSSGDIEEVKNFLRKNVDINTANIDGLTALHQACIDQNMKMVEFLVENSADVNVCDNEGWTPLHATASCGFSEIARYLINNGADVGSVNNDGDLPFDICEDGMMEKLLQQEMDKQGVDAAMARSAEEDAMLVDANHWLNNHTVKEKPHSITGATALHVSSAKGYLKVIKVLMQADANINCLDFDGWTPLHAAAHWGQEEVCRLLAENGCDMTIENFSRQTPFDVADESLLDLMEELKVKQATLRDKANLVSDLIENKSRDKTRRSSVTRMSIDQKLNVQHKTQEGERAVLSTTEVAEKSSSSSGSEDDTTDSETEKQNAINKQASESVSGSDVVIINNTDPVVSNGTVVAKDESTEEGDVKAKTESVSDLDDVFEPKPNLSRAPSTTVDTDSTAVVTDEGLPRSESMTEGAKFTDVGQQTAKDAGQKPSEDVQAEKPATEKPATQKPAMQKPTAEKPAAEKPAAQPTENERLQPDAAEDAKPPPKRLDAAAKSSNDIQKRLQAISKPTEELQKRLDAARAQREARAVEEHKHTDPATGVEAKPGVNQSSEMTDKYGGGADSTSSMSSVSSISSVTKDRDTNLLSPKSPTTRSRFEPPSRDEEAELQRKARAKRSRETRRPTQGVTQDEVIQAQEALRQTSADKTATTTTATTSVPATTASTATTTATTTVLTVPTVDVTDFTTDTAPRVPPTEVPPPSSTLLSSRRPRTWEDRKDLVPKEEETRTPVFTSRRSRFPSSLSSSMSSVPSIDDSTPRSSYTRNSYTGSSYDPTAPNSAITRSVSLRRSRLSDLETREADEKKDENKEDKTGQGREEKKDEKIDHEPKQSSAIRARRKRSERHPTGINDPSIIGKENEDTNKDETPPAKIDNSYYSRGRFSRPVSYSELSKSSPSLDSQDYKKCYEDEKCENERLKKDLDQTKRDLEMAQRELERTIRKRDADSKQEKRALERKVSEQEEELKLISKLKMENEKLKDENRALARVVAKLSR